MVTTPDFPEAYISNTSNAWLITVTHGAINLVFTEFDIQSGSTNATCDHDKLEVSILDFIILVNSTFLCEVILP